MALLRLDADKILSTVETLSRRIAERFPTANLNGVCGQLLTIVKATKVRAAKISRPAYGLRILSALLVVSLIAGIIGGWMWIHPKTEELRAQEFIQAVEASLNAILIIGATTLFLITLEVRIKRRRAIRALHELRSLAHIIDMHQLTKDPERLTQKGQDTKSSPERSMTKFELGRYLDYCSEMLSLIGKIAALYVADFDDAVVVDTVNDIEDLTTGLSRKVWQKIMILHSVQAKES